MQTWDIGGQALVAALVERPWGQFDFLSLDDVCRLTGWDCGTAAVAIREASRAGWLRSFGPEEAPLGCSLRQAALHAVATVRPERVRA